MKWAQYSLSKIGKVLLVIGILAVAGLIGYQLEILLPFNPPRLNNTYTPISQPPPSNLRNYDVLGKVVEAETAAKLIDNEAENNILTPENGAIEITEDLIKLGRRSFYLESFGNEVFNTEVTGILDSPLNPVSISKAILALKNQGTTNLQIPVEEDITVGGQTFKAGTVLNTGIDVPKGSPFPVGVRLKWDKGKLESSLTCALCHAAINPETGKIMEGAPNVDLDAGLLLALASNSAAWFRHTGVNPLQMPTGDAIYTSVTGKALALPDAEAMENAVDKALLDWPPGYFDSSSDLVENPAQIPSSYTYNAWPYGWNGFASVGWFHGLTTFNNNVHAANTDVTSLANASETILGISKDVYLGTILQNASNSDYRLPPGENPSKYFDQIDPTPESPGLNELIKMPNYPQASVFVVNGLMASSPGYPVGQQNNGMSAWQNTLSPPPNPRQEDYATLAQGAEVFDRAGCVACHSGRYFTNHKIIPVDEIQTQASRGKGNAKFARILTQPRTYTPNTPVPIPSNPQILEVPTDITSRSQLELAYAQNNRNGGYKVPSLIGLHVTAPYLHDGGVAASENALKPSENGFYTVANPAEMGIAGTQLKGILPDPESSLRVLLDRSLRQSAIAANHQNPHLQAAKVEGIGHSYWVDADAGFTPDEQTALVQFLLSLDDDPKVFFSYQSTVISQQF